MINKAFIIKNQHGEFLHLEESTSKPPVFSWVAHSVDGEKGATKLFFPHARKKDLLAWLSTEECQNGLKGNHITIQKIYIF